MPEQISKYPDVTLKVLKGAGARCGEGTDQKILTKCPPDRFCSLTTGEICVYGIEDIPKMTQITADELAEIVCPTYQESSLFPNLPSSNEMVPYSAIFIVGLLAGFFIRKFKIGS
jgi:hypothetical protein